MGTKCFSLLVAVSLVTLVLFMVFLSGSPVVTFISPHMITAWRYVSTLYMQKDEVCTERRRVAFVKVHKAASTTVTTILQRFGVTRNLTFALPPANHVWHIGLFETLKPENLSPIPDGAVYEILCQHVVYNREAFRKYLPPDIAVIAAVRDPLERFVSSFQYFYEYRQSVTQRSKARGNDTVLMREFLRHPALYEPEPYKRGSLVINRMSFDFGIPKHQYKNASFVDEYIKMVDENMEFVLVAEHFDASVVILKRKLCWSTKDILYRTRHKGTKQKMPFPGDIISRFKELSQSDYQLYEYFSKKFQRIAAAEVKLYEEVSLFQETLKNVTGFCDHMKNNAIQVMKFDKTPFSEGFNITKSDCFYLSNSEENFVHTLWKKQAFRA